MPKHTVCVKAALRVSQPPERPLMVYDGECAFCVRWIGRWKRVAGETFAQLPFQDPQIAARFPEIPRAQFETAVHLILPDGSVFGGAAAVFESLASTRWRWLRGWYQQSTLFARLTEAGYRFVARHREFFSRLG